VHNPVTIRSVTNPAVRTGSVSSLCCGGLADDPLYYPDYLRSWHEAFPSFEEDHPTLGVVAVRLAPGQQPRPASVPTKSPPPLSSCSSDSLELLGRASCPAAPSSAARKAADGTRTHLGRRSRPAAAQRFISGQRTLFQYATFPHPSPSPAGPVSERTISCYPEPSTRDRDDTAPRSVARSPWRRAAESIDPP